MRRDRDIILLDQRGTGRSHRLDCDYGDAEHLSSASTKSKSAPANIKCRDELSKNSDLRMYTTSIAVRDLDTVRRALGYQRINLYGNSYGTRVAQHYARRYPKSTRTVILDGVVNPEVVLGPAIAIDAERALERILKRCAADATCAKAFTDPSADYRALRAQLTATPVKTMVSDAATGRPIHFDFTARHLSAVLRFASYNDDQAALLPLSLHLATHEENFTPLASQFRVFAHSLAGRVRLRHAQQRGLQRRRAADRCVEARSRRAQRHAHGRRAGAAAHRSLQGLAAGRGRCRPACAAQERAPPRCCCRARTIR